MNTNLKSAVGASISSLSRSPHRLAWNVDRQQLIEDPGEDRFEMGSVEIADPRGILER